MPAGAVLTQWKGKGVVWACSVAPLMHWPPPKESGCLSCAGMPFSLGAVVHLQPVFRSMRGRKHSFRGRKTGFWAGDGPSVPDGGPHTHPPLSQWCGPVSSFLLLLDFPHSRRPFLLRSASGFLRWCSQPFLVGLALASCPACCSQPSAPLSPTAPECWSPT